MEARTTFSQAHVNTSDNIISIGGHLKTNS
jgi:hypothetical protein